MCSHFTFISTFQASYLPILSRKKQKFTVFIPFWVLKCKESYTGAIKSMKGWNIGANLNIKHGEHPNN